LKFSVIIPTHNNLPLLAECLASVFRNTKDFELIVINDCSTDTTVNYLNSIVAMYPNFFFATLDKNIGFAGAVNFGLEKSKGDYIIVLNNDTVVTPGWADRMTDVIPKALKHFDIQKIGIVGPVTNNAGGDQQVQTDPYDVENLDSFTPNHAETYKNSFMLSGFISGFCMLITRECFSAVGLFDTGFKIGGWEDNDYCLRAHLAGFNAVIDQSTFIHHYGQSTLKQLKINYTKVFRSNQLYFLDKYFSCDSKKLITVCRARNAAAYLPTFLSSASIYSDEIIVLLDRCTDDSNSICKQFPKVIEILYNSINFDEIRDRTRLLDAATKHNADWILSLDADEIMEDSFTYECAHELMSPLNPEILGYMFNFFNFFNGQSHYRTDGVFGNMFGTRMWRALPDQHPRSMGHKGLHCTHGPMLPKHYLRLVNSRVKHYGYDSPEKCREKYNFYTSLDPNPDLRSVGPEGYSHLISNSISLNRWNENISLSLCMIVKNEEINLFAFLAQYYHYFNEIVIIDTGSSDRTIKVAETFGAKVFSFNWSKDFSAARNFAKKHCSCSWILSLDPDEGLEHEDFKIIYKLIESSSDAFLFQVVNFLPDGQTAYSDNVRLIRNIPEIYYSNFVHENITKSVSKNKLLVSVSPVFLKHYGFLKDKNIKDRKTNAYLNMLKRQIKANPDDASGYFHLAFHLFDQKKEPEAFDMLYKCLSLQSTFFLAHKELGLKYLDKALHHFNELKEIIPNNHYFFQWSHEVANHINHALQCYPNRLNE